MIEGINGSGMTDITLQKLQQMKNMQFDFDEIDADKNGSLDKIEFQNFMDNVSKAEENKNPNDLFGKIDLNQNETIDKSEINIFKENIKKNMMARMSVLGFNNSITQDNNNDTEEDFSNYTNLQ